MALLLRACVAQLPTTGNGALDPGAAADLEDVLRSKARPMQRLLRLQEDAVLFHVTYAAIDAVAARERGGAAAAARLLERARGLAARGCCRLRCPTPQLSDGSHAGAPGAGKWCSACRGVRYCSRLCQRYDWDAHKLVCGALQREAAAAAEREAT